MEAAMGESTEDALDSSNSHTSATGCRADMHLNGEVNGSCRDNVDMCGIISCDIAPSKLLNDAGNDSVGNESDNSVLSNSVGVEENGNVGSSDSDDEETMDVPSDYSSNHVQGGEHTELAVDGVMDDSGSQDGVDMDSDVAETVDSPVPNSAADDSVQGDVSETSGAMVTDNLQETDVARLGGDLQETDVDDEEDSSHDIDMEERDDMEDGDEAEGEILEEIDSVERDDDDDVEEIGRAETDDNTEESVRLERDCNAEEIGRPEREDSSEETSREERADELETSTEGKDADLQRTEERIEEESQEMSVSGPEDVLQTVNKDVEQPGSLDESMEVEDNSVTTKSVCDSTTKESDECPQPSSGMGTLSCSDRDNKDVASVETAEPDCVSTDSGVTNSVGKLGGCTDVVEVSGAVKVEDTLSSDKAEGKLDETPGKIKKARKSSTPLNVTPRRSSRNLSKTQKVYSEHEEDPDIEEITPQDPLADPLSGGDVLRDKDASKPRASHHNKTIVVNDTKRLVEIAAGSKPSKGRKKEPTLVIIDTNSILSGRGPIPVSQSVQSSGNSSTPGYSMLPVALPAQGLYPNSVAPSASPTVMPNPLRTSTPIATTPQSRQPPPQILPSLTDDMYVVEAPSFIVPYVYEKPPIKPLKEYVEGMGKELEKLKEERERKASEASNKTSEQSATEKADTSKNSGEGKSVQEKDEDKRGEKEKLNANDGSINLSEQNKVTNGENGEGSENSKQLNKLDTSELKHEVKSSSINGDISMELDGKEGLKSEDKDKRDLSKAESTKPTTYFDNPLGKFFMQIGVNLVQEYVQTDLLRSQKKKRDREGGRGASVTQFAIGSLLKNLELSKENNEPFHLPLKKCNFCNFKTESALVMAQHLETPHMKNYVYRCNFCTLEVRSPHDILFHMEAEHNVRGRLERAPAFHQCPNCPFEDNQKGKLSRHLFSCGKKFKPEKNQEPPLDWEPPAKIPRVSRNRPSSMGIAYQALTNKQAPQHPLLPKLVPSPQLPVSVGSGGRGRGRPPLHSRYLGDVSKVPVQRPIAPTQIRQSMLYRSTASGSPMLVPTTYQISGNQIYQVVGAQGQMMPVMSSGITPVPRIALMSTASTPPSVVSSAVSSAGPTPVTLVPSNAITIQNAHKNNPTAKLLQQPSISITPLPRQPATVTPPTAGIKQATTSSGGKATFVICEICDGYIKDLEQLRNHMQWIHKVKIHPKMIYNRPPLNCQKCQFRFFTDQGLERHLLGSHGLVTSSMQEAANKGKDGGRCPVCGRVYQWKLLNHVARDHNMTLKPAHLSYKCTVCTATFGMYKQFENHVYSAHSVVAKRVMDKKTSPSQSSRSSGAAAAGDSLLKPLKINDEITIIPQPARPRPGPASRTGAVSAAAQAASGAKVWQCDDCEATFDGPTGFVQFTAHMKRRHLRRCSVRLCRLDACPTCKRRHVTGAVLEWLRERSGVDVIELSDDEVVIGQGRSEITITKVSCAPGPKRFKQRLQRTKVQVIEIEDSPVKTAASEENGEDSLTAVKERLRRRKSLEISQIDSDGSPQTTDDLPSKKRRKTGDD